MGLLILLEYFYLLMNTPEPKPKSRLRLRTQSSVVTARQSIAKTTRRTFLNNQSSSNLQATEKNIKGRMYTQRCETTMTRNRNTLAQQDKIQLISRRKRVTKKQLLSARLHISFIKNQFDFKPATPYQKLYQQEIETNAQNFYRLAMANPAQAMNIMIKLLHYSIDLNLVNEFLVTVFQIADFYFIFGQAELALFFYNQCRLASNYTQNYKLLINSLISMSKCASKINLHESGIMILKKALEYAWLTNDIEKQLQIYDQIGIKYYRMGLMDKAEYFHKRFQSGAYESELSSLKNSIINKLKQKQFKEYKTVQTQINSLFLTRLNLPLRTTEELKPNIPGLGTARNQFLKFLKNKQLHPGDIQKQLKKIMKQKQFSQQMPNMFLEINGKYHDKLSTIRHKVGTADLELNKKLLKYKLKYKIKSAAVNQHDITNPLLYKLNLDQKVKNRLKAKPLDADWYQNIVDRAKSNRKFLIENFQNEALMRGIHKEKNVQLSKVKQMYNSFYIQVLYA